MGDRFGIDKSFQTAVKAFRDDTAYWVLGHAFDTLLDCLHLCRPLDDKDQPSNWKDLAHMALDKLHWLDGKPPPDCHEKPKPKYYAQGESWYDDSGWWVVASLKAYLLAKDLGWGEYQEDFRKLCLAKWARFDDNAPKVYDTSGKAGDGLDPLYPGGVWNSTWPNSPADQCCTDRCDPRTSNLGGFQNTVTNMLYLVCAERLCQAHGDGFIAPDAGRADRELKFLSDWFKPDRAKVDPLLNRFAGEKGPVVVRERVTAYNNGSRPKDYDPEQAWTGDQGILLGGLIERADRVKDEAATLLRFATDLIDGALLYNNDGNGMLLNWPLKLDAPGGAGDAYSTGFGVFMRYLTRALDNDFVRQHVMGEKLLWRPNNDPHADPVMKTYRDLFRDMVGKVAKDDTPFGKQCSNASPLTMAINDLAVRVLAFKLFA
jgi:hypothetical protein